MIVVAIYRRHSKGEDSLLVWSSWYKVGEFQGDEVIVVTHVHICVLDFNLQVASAQYIREVIVSV